MSGRDGPGTTPRPFIRAGFKGSDSGRPADGWRGDSTSSALVRNLPDGRVELVAEGEAAEIDRFLEAIHQETGGLSSATSLLQNSSPRPRPTPRKASLFDS